MKRIRKTRGFTLIELVLVIAILGILAVTAFPTFFDISLTNARANAEAATMGAVRSGLSLYAANEVAGGAAESYPADLDAVDASGANQPGSVTNRLFSTVLQNGVTSNQWSKLDGDCYSYDDNGNGSHTDGTDSEYQYDSAAGTFLGVTDCGS